MIQKNEETIGEAEVKVSRIKSIAGRRKTLEEELSRVQKQIQERFMEMVETVRGREKQLLRQAEAIHRQQMSVAESNEDVAPVTMCVLFEEMEDIVNRIQGFGRIELCGSDSLRITNLEPYRIAEYQDSEKDHVSFDKFIAENSPDGERLTESTDIERSTNREILEEPDIFPPGTTTHTSFDQPLKRHSLEQPPDTSRLDHNPEEHTKEPNNTTIPSSSIVTDSPARTTTDPTTTCNKEIIEDQEENIDERRRSSGAHPEQVQQWLQEILRETEIEPTIHEVEKLPEICYWRKVDQVES